MSLRTISCGAIGSIDKVAFSPSGRYIARCGAPGRTLSVIDSRINRKVRCPDVADATCVAMHNDDRQTEVLYQAYKAPHIQRFTLASRQELKTLYMGRNYDVTAIVVSPCGQFVAAGNSKGEVFLWDLSDNDKPELVQRKAFHSASIHALAFNADSSELFIANEAKQQQQWTIASDSVTDIHGNLQWPAYAFSCHRQESAFAMGGDGERVWLIDLPFKLGSEDPDTAGDGFPLSHYDLDQAGAGTEELALRNRIYLPDVDAYRCAYLNSNVGSFVNHLHLSRDWKLLIGGQAGLEVWDLQSLNLLKQIPFPKNTSWRQISSVIHNDEFFVTYDY